jgi:hypothetical protein
MKFLTIQMNDRLRDFLWEMHIIPKPWQRPSLADIRTLQVPPGLKVEPFTRHVFRRPDQTLILTSARHMTYTHAALPAQPDRGLLLGRTWGGGNGRHPSGPKGIDPFVQL